MATTPKKRRFGSGKVDPNAGGSQKWVGAIAHQARDYETQVAVKRVPLGSVRADPNNPRNLAISAQDIEAIAKAHPFDADAMGDIESYGRRISHMLSGPAFEDFVSIAYFAATLESHERLINPVTVWQDDLTFQLVAGERRYLAHVLLGAPEIVARILPEPPSELHKIKIQWEENSLREDLSLHERILNLRSLIRAWQEESGREISINSLAKLAGMGHTTAQRYLLVIRCPHELIEEAIRTGRVKNIKKAAALASLDEQGVQQALAPRKPEQTLASAPRVSVSPARNYQPLALLIEAGLDRYGNEDLRKKVSTLDLKSRKGVTEAMSLLLRYMEE